MQWTALPLTQILAMNVEPSKQFSLPDRSESLICREMGPHSGAILVQELCSDKSSQYRHLHYALGRLPHVCSRHAVQIASPSTQRLVGIDSF